MAIGSRRLNAWLDQQPIRQGSTAGVPPPESQDAPSIICVECMQWVPLWDEMEQHFASDETRRKVRELQEQAAIVLDTGDKERAGRRGDRYRVASGADRARADCC